MSRVAIREPDLTAETVLAGMLDASVEAISVVDREYCYIHVNRAWFRIMGVEPQPVRGVPVSHFVGDEVFETVAKPLFDRCFSGETIVYETVMDIPRRGKRRGRVVVTPLRAEDGGIVAAITRTRDASVERATQKELAQVTHLLETAITASPVPMALLNGDGELYLFNRALAALCGWSDAVRPGHRWADVAPVLRIEASAETERIDADPVGAALAGDTVNGQLMQVVRSDGSDRWVVATAVPIVDDSVVVAVMAVFSDITDLRALQERAFHDDKMRAIGELAGGVAHDFNNQLAGMVACADLLLVAADDPDKVRSYAEKILTAGKRAAALTGSLLTFSRKQAARVEPVDVHALIAEVVGLLERTIDPVVRVETALFAEHSVVLGDAGQLQNALLNLGINARDAMPNGGVLRFSTRQKVDENGVHIAIAVSDTGEGIPPELHARVFEPFFTTKEKGKGTGMGLATVWSTVRAASGTIALDSAPGKGSTFTIVLPLAQGQGEPSAPSPAEAVPARPASRRILLVDDEPTVRESCAAILEKRGYTVVCCADGTEACAAYADAAEPFDVVVLDMIMPRMSGPEVVATIRAQCPEQPVVLCSGYALDEETQRLINQGTTWFLRKPFRAKDLVQLVERAQRASSASS